ncbi:hypothetical protein EV188_1091 [Actinomycetospora succinea]|uniref:Uncharacterized protein n=1 Tax=Actinomycetospora succinea TaxID=663603 RepID=A0A4R6UXY0_9PSEU|nr:hypothetical protein [Actinomycetospora succinea]TDQ50793.1 hypothetical protein EV188_1091 [Actinomycetospora succinea]
MLTVRVHLLAEVRLAAVALHDPDRGLPSATRVVDADTGVAVTRLLETRRELGCCRQNAYRRLDDLIARAAAWTAPS